MRASVGALIVVAVLGSLVAGAAARTGAQVKIASGHLAGTAWTLRATVAPGTSGPGYLNACFSLALVGGRLGGGHPSTGLSCGQMSVQSSSPTDKFFGMTERGEEACPGFGLEYGAVVSPARTVKLTLSNGSTVRTATISPPPGVPKNLRFYATPVPCSTSVSSAVATSGSGHVVARLDLGGLP